MTKMQIMLGSLLGAAALAVAGPAIAVSKKSGKAPKGTAKALSGGVKISVHTHSNDNPVSPGLLFPTDRLAYNFSRGDDFSYSSRPCGLPAPFNEIGLDFRPNYPGIDDTTGTAAVRHRAEGTVTSVKKNGRGTIEGTITSVLCVTENGVRTESDNVIVTHYRAKYRRTSDNEIQLTGRFTFSPTRSTGTFEDLRGGGSLKAILTCLRHVRDASAPTCKNLGHYTDFVGLRGDTSAPVGETVPGLVGHFRDPTR